MKLVVDNETLGTDHGSLDAALEAGVAHASAAGRVVVDVLLDGRVVDDEAIRQGVTGDELTLSTDAPGNLTATTARQAIDALARADQLQTDAVEALDTGDRALAMEHLSEAFECWSAARQTLELGAQLVGADLSTFQASSPAGTVVAGEAIEALVRALEEARDAVQAEDDPALSDVLSGPVSASVVRWQALLSMLASVAQA